MIWKVAELEVMMTLEDCCAGQRPSGDGSTLTKCSHNHWKTVMAVKYATFSPV
jgi:hypothetical protein